MRIFRILLFKLFFVFWTFFICTICFPFVFFGEKYALFVRKIWAKVTIFAFQFINSVEFEVRGLENLPKNEPIIVASKHQSAFETVAFCLILNEPVYILKKELSQIPIFGSYIIRSGMIAIDRSLKASVIKRIVENAERVFAKKRHLVIFPEGTRVQIGKSKAYQSGVSALYLSGLAKVVPVALNSGCFWPKGVLLPKERPAKCVIEFLEPVENNLEKHAFISLLHEKIESKSIELLK